MLTADAYPPPAAPAGGSAPGGGSARTIWAWVRVLGGISILAVLVWRVGVGGFLDGLRQINPGILLAASAIGLLTTVLGAWRWCLVARGLGIALPLPAAVGDYYRALFLNAALPGGVLGDVHRAVNHGRDVGDLALGARAVALERAAGQAVITAASVVLLLLLPTPALAMGQLVSPGVAAGLAAAALVAGGLLVAVWAGSRLRREGGRWVRACRTTVATLRHGLLARQVWPGVVLSSVAVLAGCLVTFLLAARAAGVTAPVSDLLPLLVLALLAMALPLNVGGWGPREGVCAWAFAAAGLGAAQGLTVAVIYGVSVFVASLPGAAVLVLGRPARRAAESASAAPAPPATPATLQDPATAPNRSESA